VKPIAQVREKLHSSFIVTPTTMVRKNTPFPRTFDSHLKEKENSWDSIFMRTILSSLKENVVDDVGTMNRVKPLLEVTRILQRVGSINPRCVFAN